MGKQEEAIVELIRSTFGEAGIELGIGDDAAVFDAGGPLSITTDMLIEGIDFTRDIPVELIAKKSLAANVSDLAAMGSEPYLFVLGLGLPAAWRGELERFVVAMRDAARECGIRLVGGDLSSAAEFIVSITALGRAGGRVLRRSAARAGERLYVSRPLGGAAAGLGLFERGWRIDAALRATPPDGTSLDYRQSELAASVLRQFVSPVAEWALGKRLSAESSIGACIDISDGLSTDLRRLCRASGVAARIEWERIPLFPDLDNVGRSLGLAPEDAALHGGEEFALLFTSSAGEATLSSRLGRPVYMIGTILDGEGVTLARNGVEVELGDYGHDHFA